ncbi:GNAT family N-acetyltransferase [Moraxella pluranimalium]|uniref:N-acetyltransferase domain-containing protein n=1 Tax=Moraxella pluranimalium TaxID=470453 RepID=A0A1T0CU35_9GAMM|nr:GNAT family N-acetyltransferase [Moraxella pluranimalium]OOS25631.1 hypothetical protein B0680_02060 [Moraxella pluranimalium]
MIQLTLLQPQHHLSLMYSLDDEQSKFTRPPHEWLDNHTLDVHKIVIVSDDEVVGFFVLDQGDNKYHYTDDQNSLLLRSMSINPAHQGKGYAKQALMRLGEFICHHGLHANKVVLGVHHKNITAQALYQKVGFVRTSKDYMGIKGLQYSYELVINS